MTVLRAGHIGRLEEKIDLSNDVIFPFFENGRLHSVSFPTLESALTPEVSSIYTSDGEVTGNRDVTGNNGRRIRFRSYDTNVNTFTNRANVFIDDTILNMSYDAGDGSGGFSGIRDISLSSGGMVITDSSASKGFEYASDYSVNFTSRSLVDKGYVDSVALGGGNLSLGNVGREVTFEGNNGDLTINAYTPNADSYTSRSRYEQFNSGFQLTAASGDGAGADSSIARIEIDTTRMRITDTINNRGLAYAADYSANYTDRSLVDRTYADRNVAYGEIYGTADSTLTITTIDTPVQYTGFTANGQSANTTPDHTNDHITITRPGRYFVTLSMSARLNSNMGGGFITFYLNLNNGTTEITQAPLILNQVLDVNRTGSISTILNLAANDTLELWGESSSVIDIVVRNANLACSMLEAA